MITSTEIQATSHDTTLDTVRNYLAQTNGLSTLLKSIERDFCWL